MEGDCQQCHQLKARISELEAELRALRGEPVADSTVVPSEPSSGTKDALQTVIDGIFTKPQVTPSDIKSVNFAAVEKCVDSNNWSAFADAFTSFASESNIKAIAFLVCFEGKVKASKAVRSLLSTLRSVSDTDKRVVPVLERAVFEIFKVKLASFTDNEVMRGRQILAEFVEEEAFADDSDGAVSGKRQEIDAFISAAGAEFCEARAWEFIRRVIWPSFPSDEGTLQERIRSTLLSLLKDVTDRHIVNSDLKKIIHSRL